MKQLTAQLADIGYICNRCHQPTMECGCDAPPTVSHARHRYWDKSIKLSAISDLMHAHYGCDWGSWLLRFRTASEILEVTVDLYKARNLSDTDALERVMLGLTLKAKPRQTVVDKLEAMKRTLTPRRREVVELRAQGFTHKQIGERLGISEQTSRNLQTRAST